MAKKQTIEHMIHSTLKDKIAFGNNKHEDKQELGFGKSSYKIYSYKTYSVYLEQCRQYGKWLSEEKGIGKLTDLGKTEGYAKEYIQHRLESGVSVYTAKMERSALGMLYGKPIDVEMPTRDNKNITRSRSNQNERHYNRQEGRYKDIFTIALASGGRRKDLARLTPQDFIQAGDRLFVQFNQSKGGRDRLTYIREEYKQQVMEIVEQAKNSQQEKLFPDGIPSNIDIHALRREYTSNLYQDIQKDPELRQELLSHYPPRHEYKTQKDRDGTTYTQEIKRGYYKDRDGNIYDRDDIYILSQNLGHNRLDVSVTHYLKK